MKLKILILSILVALGTGIILIFSLSKKDVKADWINELNYRDDQIYDISFGLFNPCPSIPVMIDDKNVKLEFDTGNGKGIFLTTLLEKKVDFVVTGKITNLNADGTYRGEGSSILLNKINVLGQEYTNVNSSISDWKMYGDLKFNGTVGLSLFPDKVITLDYKNKKIAITDKPIDYTKLKGDKYVILPLIKSNADNQRDLIYFEGYVNGEKSTIYLDTGSSRSFIDLGDENNRKNYNSAEVKLGDREYQFNNLKIGEIKRGGDFQYPLMLAINSDILKSMGFIITVDRIENKIIIH